MRLTELKPKWVRRNGKAVGFVFICPRCMERPPGCDGKGPTWLTCWWEPVGQKEQFALIAGAIAAEPADFAGVTENDVVTTALFTWKKNCKDFARISVTPSIDASKSGHWHGHIVNGLISVTPAKPTPKPAAGRVPCYFLKPLDPVRTRRALRVFEGVEKDTPKCPGRLGFHDARFPLGDFGDYPPEGETPAAADARWPLKCDHCAHVFGERAHRLLDADAIYTRSDNGALQTLHEAGPGAMWWAPWYGDHTDYRGPDGRCLVVRLPDGHDWIVDSRASNCSMPKDTTHKCWIRHGEPPNVTVDKNGRTCKAGAGSIKTDKYHGHLRGGFLVAS